MHRREIVFGSASVVVLGGLALLLKRGVTPARAEAFEVTLSDEEWKKRLSPEAYDVLRHQGTEYPGTSPLLNEHRVGIFGCAGCDLPNFDSKTKFDSGTGWPSFYDALPNAVIKSVDNSLGMTRDEIHCRRCGGHLGHVFDDGPQPTGLRYCMNGVALKFTPAAT
ncbi:MAG: peptide-methionine (R)-S-oxide reductase MsrB [Devosia sp.]|nr:peptide-methionine (R)-S-oxide reductase MsrB [Devosia sp.]